MGRNRGRRTWGKRARKKLPAGFIPRAEALEARALPSGFAPAVTLNASTSPNSVLIADVTGDGKPDVVASDTGNTILSLFPGRADGTFGPTVNIPAGKSPSSVVAGDFDGDGKLDLAVANYSVAAGSVSVMLANGGGFTSPATFPTQAGTTRVALGDFNRDGRLDIAAANLNINTVSVLLGNGNGTFTPQASFATGVSPESIAVGDFNRDNKLDLLVPNRSSNTLSLLLGNGDGTFLPEVSVPAGNQPNFAVAGDFNGDSRLDVAVANYGGNDVSVFLGNGNGTFAAPASLTAGAKPNWVTAGDINGDGRLDLAAANFGNNNVSVFLGNGNGAFATLGTFATGLTPAAIAAGDLNGDGAPDLVTANIQADTLSLLLNLGGTRTSLASSANPALPGQSVTLTATVQPVFGGTPTGTVTFKNGATPLATVALSNGSARYATPFPPGGTPLTAVYNGDGNFNPSVSATLTQVVRSPALFVTGADAGGGPDVKVFNADGSLRFGFFAFDMGFTGGVRVAAGDVNGDGFPDVICAAGPGGGPNIRVFDGRDGKPLAGPLASIFPYDPRFSGGVFVASGDVNGDGFADIITAADAGGGPDVKVIDGKTGSPLYSFFTYDLRFGGGIRVAAGDVDGDGKADVITGAGPGGGPDVKVYRGFDGQFLRSFFAYAADFNGGVYVAAGDVTGDGKAEVIVGAGPGGGPDVSIFNALTGTRLSGFFPYDPRFAGGVRVAAIDRNGDGREDVLTVAGPGGGADVRTTDGVTLKTIDQFFAYDPRFTGGLYVSASR